MSKSNRLTIILNGMKYRCYNHSCKGYKNYGARGITVCDEWLNNERINIGCHNNSTKGFIAFQKWALVNGYKENLTLDRIDYS